MLNPQTSSIHFKHIQKDISTIISNHNVIKVETNFNIKLKSSQVHRSWLKTNGPRNQQQNLKYGESNENETQHTQIYEIKQKQLEQF
jgi:hypothetical protein